MENKEWPKVKGGEKQIRSLGLTCTQHYIYKIDNQQGPTA